MGMSRRRVLLAKLWSTKEITTIYNALALSLFSDSWSLGAGDDKPEIECIHLGYRFVALLATRTRRKGFSISSFKALNSPREWWQTVDRLHPVHLLRLPCQGKWSLGYLRATHDDVLQLDSFPSIPIREQRNLFLGVLLVFNSDQIDYHNLNAPIQLIRDHANQYSRNFPSRA